MSNNDSDIDIGFDPLAWMDDTTDDEESEKSPLAQDEASEQESADAEGLEEALLEDIAEQDALEIDEESDMDALEQDESPEQELADTEGLEEVLLLEEVPLEDAPPEDILQEDTLEIDEESDMDSLEQDETPEQEGADAEGLEEVLLLEEVPLEDAPPEDILQEDTLLEDIAQEEIEELDTVENSSDETNIPEASYNEYRVTLSGKIDISNARQLMGELSEALNQDAPIILAAGEVERADGAALQLLTAFIRKLKESDREIVWEEPSEQLVNAATIIGLRETLHLP